MEHGGSNVWSTASTILFCGMMPTLGVTVVLRQSKKMCNMNGTSTFSCCKQYLKTFLFDIKSEVTDRGFPLSYLLLGFYMVCLEPEIVEIYLVRLSVLEKRIDEVCNFRICRLSLFFN